MPSQLRGRLRSAAARGRICGDLEHRGDHRIRLQASAADVSRPLLGILDELGEHAVCRPPLLGRGAVVGRGREQRVREAEPISLVLEHPCLDGFRESRVGVGRNENGRRRLPERACVQERAPRIDGERARRSLTTWIMLSGSGGVSPGARPPCLATASAIWSA